MAKGNGSGGRGGRGSVSIAQIIKAEARQAYRTAVSRLAADKAALSSGKGIRLEGFFDNRYVGGGRLTDAEANRFIQRQETSIAAMRKELRGING